MEKTNQNTFWISHLRAFITVLVVFHHANLSYTTYAFFDNEIYINSTHPVVDDQRWIGTDILVNFNDIYFMSLMFLIGGLFLIKSIRRKGRKNFLTERFKRLFVPFITIGTFFMLIAYFPGYYLATGSLGFSNYIVDFFFIQNWPVGPPWFVWVLFLFNVLFAISYVLFSKFYDRVGKKFIGWQQRPIKIIFGFVAFTALLYIPLSYFLGTSYWVGFGPFDFQLNRILLYLGYFMLGVVMGSFNFNNSLFATQSLLVKLWKIWWGIAIGLFILVTVVPEYLIYLVKMKNVDDFYTWMIYFFSYTLSCCFTSLAMLTSFKALVKTTGKIWNSLIENAYMIYLCHFPFITWIQFLLLGQEIHPLLKTTIVFLLSFLLSWVLSIQLRKNRMIARYV